MKLPNFIEKVFQKLDIMLSIRRFKNGSYQKTDFIKKRAPRLVFFIEKKSERFE